MNDRHYALCSITLSGVKNLIEPVTLSFVKRKVPGEVPYEGTVKAIYGSNGAGKTALLEGVRILKSLIIDPNFVAGHESLLHDVISKTKKRFDATVDFIEMEHESRKAAGLYRYRVSLSKKGSGPFSIEEESLYRFLGLSFRDDKAECLYSSKGGALESVHKSVPKEISKELKEKALNIASMKSIPAIASSSMDLDASGCFYTGMKALMGFAHSLLVFIDREETVALPFISEEKPSLPSKEASKNNAYIIPKEGLPEFEESIKRLYGFISLFKRDLVGIEIEKREIGRGFCGVSLVYVYPEYRLDSSLESKGVQLLESASLYIAEAMKGAIVFIDELDRSVNGVVLSSLLDYVRRYAEGQLVFTVHNPMPMKVLAKGKRGLDFLGDDREVRPWAKNGNYSPEKLYGEGMIPGLPFNIDENDFLEAFPPSGDRFVEERGSLD